MLFSFYSFIFSTQHEYETMKLLKHFLRLKLSMSGFQISQKDQQDKSIWYI